MKMRSVGVVMQMGLHESRKEVIGGKASRKVKDGTKQGNGKDSRKFEGRNDVG